MQFHEKLKQLRHQKGISQAELATKIFVSRSAIAKWESGLGLPSEESLALLANYFEVDPNMLLSDPVVINPVMKKSTLLTNKKVRPLLFAGLMALITGILLTWTLLNQCHSSFIPIPDTTFPIQTTRRELIFETECEKDTASIPNYSNEEISIDQTFGASRIMEIDEFGQVVLPQLLIKTTTKGKVTYMPVNIDAATFFYSSGLKVSIPYSTSYIRIELEDATIKKYKGYLNIQFEDLTLSIQVIKTPIPIAQMHIALSDHSTELGLIESKRIILEIQPFDATYFDENIIHIIKMEKADGTIYEEDAHSYLTIEKESMHQWVITPTLQIEIGTKVYIQAKNEIEAIQSNILIIDIMRIPIQRISYSPYQNYIDSGATLTMQLSFYPENATANLLKEPFDITLLTPNIAHIEQKEGRFYLTASKAFEDIGQSIQIQINILEGYVQTIEWEITPIPIEEIRILNRETGKELDPIFQMTRGSTLLLQAIVDPENASYGDMHYQISANSSHIDRYVSISEEGVLTISKDAPLDLEIWLSVRTGRFTSPAYHIQLQKRNLENVVLQCDQTHIAKNIPYALFCRYIPEDADIESGVHYYLLDEIEGVYLSGNLIFIDEKVEVGTVIQVIAVVDEIKSNIIALIVV
ncbi:MAG: helix-turn-helix domain-containing protein [Prevotella sp.]|nr:helix-turn-helix domain-containing protein [Staphylococcus sp.]MCM1349755.1 helix-turn-helix domain-containing protein [Prevotella sp.]